MSEPLNIKKTFRAEIKGIDLEKKTVTAIVSHAKKDRDGDVIPPEAFKKRLKDYKDHPVLQINHSYQTQDTIGKVLKIDLNDDHVEAKIQYFAGLTDASGKSLNPNADWAFELAKMGLAAYSVGFQSFGFDWIEEKDADGGKKVTGRKFTDIALLEISQVAIPANPNALQAMCDDEGADVEAKELCGLVLKGIKDGAISAQNNQENCFTQTEAVIYSEYGKHLEMLVMPGPKAQSEAEILQKMSCAAHARLEKIPSYVSGSETKRLLSELCRSLFETGQIDKDALSSLWKSAFPNAPLGLYKAAVSRLALSSSPSASSSAVTPSENVKRETLKDAIPAQQQQGELERQMSALAMLVSECQQKMTQLQADVDSINTRLDAVEAIGLNDADDMTQPKHYSRALFEKVAIKPEPISKDIPKAVSKVDLVNEVFKRINQKKGS